MSQSVTPAIQNDMTTCLETFEKERFCSFPHRHGEATGKPDSRRDMLEHQNGHFVRDVLKFSYFVASKSTFSYEFSYEPPNLLPQNRCFVRGLQPPSHSGNSSINFQHTSQNATPATKFASCRHLTQPWQCDSEKSRNTSKVLRLPRNMKMDTSKVLRLPRKLELIF